MDVNESLASLKIGQTRKEAEGNPDKSAEKVYHDSLLQADKLREKIRDHPYGLPLYVLLAREYLNLEYPDLAAGTAYKALLLSDAVQDAADEYHEQALASLSDLIPPLASDGELKLPYAEDAVSYVVDDTRDLSAQLQSIVTRHYLPLIYELLVRSLQACGCYRSAFTYCSQAEKIFPEEPVYQQILLDIRKDVTKCLKVKTEEVSAGKYSNPSSWPDSGYVRRERYPWNVFEPARLEELSFLNAMMSEVAPKLEVLAVDLPDLTINDYSYGDASGIKQLGVFAKEDIQPGEVVLTETTLLTANNKLRDTLCDACSADLPDIRDQRSNTAVSCPDCEAVFCDETCMDKAMEYYHAAVCDRDVEAIAKDVPGAEAADALYLLLLLRCFALAETQQCHPLELKEVKYIWGDFHNRQIDTLAEAETIPRSLPFSFENNIRLPFHMLEKMDIDIFANPQYDVWVFNTLYAKCRGTASARLSGSGGRGSARGPEVSAVHPMWCLANHSCDPNVSWDWSGNIEFKVREERVMWRNTKGESMKMNEAGIRKGEEVLNHYCDINLPVQDRQEWAKGALGGNCRCERCVWERAAGT